MSKKQPKLKNASVVVKTKSSLVVKIDIITFCLVEKVFLSFMFKYI